MTRDCTEEGQLEEMYTAEAEQEIVTRDQDQESDQDHNQVKLDLWEAGVYTETSAQEQVSKTDPQVEEKAITGVEVKNHMKCWKK